jgi:hypothetical protein
MGVATAPIEPDAVVRAAEDAVLTGRQVDRDPPVRDERAFESIGKLTVRRRGRSADESRDYSCRWNRPHVPARRRSQRSGSLMTVANFRELFAYDVWANSRVLKAAALLTVD